MKIKNFDRKKFNEAFVLITVVSAILRLPMLKSLIYGDYEFRQTQTAWPVKFWLANGFSPFSPSVPVRGVNPHWLLEFPLFQWLAFGVAKGFSLNADHSVKIVAFSCSVCTAYFLGWVVTKVSTLVTGLCSVAFYLCTPYGIWWGSAGLVDNLATLFGLASFSIFIAAKRSKRNQWLVVFFAVIACLIKPNVALMYASAILAFDVFEARRIRVKTFAGILTPLAATALIWSRISIRGVSIDDPRIIWYMTKDTRPWYFGTFTQYVHVPQELVELYSRTSQAMGGTLSVGLLSLFGLASTKYRMVTSAAMIGVLSSWVLFINLNLVHSYYQIPALPLLVLVVSLGLYELVDHISDEIFIHKSIMFSFPILFLVVSATEPGFGNSYWKQTINPAPEISQFAKELELKTRPDRLILVSGFTNDPTIFYEANRKGYMFDDEGKMFDIELRYFSKQDKSQYCSFAIGDNSQAKTLDAFLQLFPNASKISKHVYSWC